MRRTGAGPRALAGVAVTMLFALGCARTSGTASGSGPAPDARRQTPEQWADSVLATLSPRDRAAQMVWPQVFADYVPASSPQWRNWQRWIGEEHVGGIIVSIGSPIEMAEKLNAFQRMSRVPLIVGSDIEGGVGFRARGGYFVPNAIDLGGGTLFPQQMALGAARDTALAYELGRITAIEGRALGIHVAYAPVVDVNNNPANPVIGNRSFGEDPALVSRLGSAVIRGIQDNGMIATAKHFPGHGDTESNSHLGIAVVGASRGRLDSLELAPFRAAIGAGVGNIMTAHVAMPAISGDSTPATLSPAVLTGLLRGQLGFHGLITTDAMDMHGVLAEMGLAEATQRAVAAGADVVLMPPEIGVTVDAIVSGVRDGRYTQARVDSSARRILVMKAKVGLDRGTQVSLERVRAEVGDSAHVASARLAAERGITLVRDSLGTVPLQPTPSSRVLAVTVARRSDLGAGRDFDAELRRSLPNVRSLFVEVDEPAGYQRALALADSADVTIVSTYALATLDQLRSNAAPAGLVELVRGLSRKPTRTVVVAFGDPYLLRHVPEVGTYLVAWGAFPASQWAAARALAGRAAITGRLPITIPGQAAFGTGIQRQALPTPAANRTP